MTEEYKIPILKTVEQIYCPSIDEKTLIFLKRIEPYYLSEDMSYELFYYCTRVDACSDFKCMFRKYVRKGK